MIVRLGSGREVEVWCLVGRPARLHGHPDSWHPDEGVELEVLDQVSDDERAEACRLALDELQEDAMLAKSELLQIGWQSARNCGRELMASTDAPAYVEAALGAWDDEIVFAAPCKLGPDEWGLIASCEGDVLYFDPKHVIDFDFRV